MRREMTTAALALAALAFMLYQTVNYLIPPPQPPMIWPSPAKPSLMVGGELWDDPIAWRDDLPFLEMLADHSRVDRNWWEPEERIDVSIHMSGGW